MALAWIVLLLNMCQKEKTYEVYKLPDFKDAEEILLNQDMEYPSGLARCLNSTKHGLLRQGTVQDNLSGVFLEGPLYVPTGPGRSLEGYRGPIISEFLVNSEDLNYISTRVLSELDLSIYPLDFDTFYYYALPDSLWRGSGLTMDNLVLNDGSILTSSNSSDKIFITKPSGESEIYLQDEELQRITDLILGSNNKIYAVKSPLIDSEWSAIVISPKKVISIENKTIYSEFELPTDINTHSWGFNYFIGNWWRDAPFLEKLRIVENSANGKKRFGAAFYISDMLEGKIYKVDASKNIEVIASGLRFPSSIAVDSTGNIFYTTSPMWSGYSVSFPSQLHALNPETGNSVLVHEFEETIDDYINSTGWAISMTYNNIKYVLPTGYNVTNILYESTAELIFLISNSNQGTLKWIQVMK